MTKEKAAGKQEEKINIAKKMILAGSDNHFIIQMTGLTLEQVETLRNEK